MSNVQNSEEVRGGTENAAGVDLNGPTHREEPDVSSGTRVLPEGRGLLQQGRNETGGSFRSPFDIEGNIGEATPSEGSGDELSDSLDEIFPGDNESQGDDDDNSEP